MPSQIPDECEHAPMPAAISMEGNHVRIRSAFTAKPAPMRITGGLISFRATPLLMPTRPVLPLRPREKCGTTAGREYLRPRKPGQM